MKYVNIILFIFVLLGCSENDNISDSKIDTKISPQVCSDSYDYLIPRIGVVSLGSDSDDPYSIELIDNSTSSGSIVSWTWEIVDVRDRLGNPTAVFCGITDCRYSGTGPLNFNLNTFLVPNIGTPVSQNGTDDHDDLLVNLEVQDSNGLVAKTSFLYASYSPLLFSGNQTKIISGSYVSSLNVDGCEIDVEVNSEVFRRDTGSGIDTVNLDVDQDMISDYVHSASAALPTSFTHDYSSVGSYLGRFYLDSAFFNSGDPDSYNNFFTEYAIRFY